MKSRATKVAVANINELPPDDHTRTVKSLNSLAAQQTLFWSSTPSREERNLKFARFGAYVTATLLVILSIVEISFFACLLWQFVR
jgi:hypothetical protein